MSLRKSGQPTIVDVARVAGASRTSVSRYLTDPTGAQMSAELRARIERAIEELDYRPSSIARGLRRNRSNVIGFVVADIANPYAVSVLRGAEEVCRAHGYVLVVCNTDGDPEIERHYCGVLWDQRVDGLLINSTGENSAFLASVAEQIPTVLVDRKLPDLGLDMVGTDNRDSMRQALDHLVGEGFESVGYFTDVVGGTSPRVERLDELHAHLAGLGRPDLATVYEYDAHGAEGIGTILDEYLAASAGRRRAVFAGNGVVLLQAYGHLMRRELHVPDDVALIGFDAPEWAEHVPPGLTVLAQPTRAIGERAMTLVLDMIRGRDAPTRTYEIPAELRVRGSTRAGTRPA